MILQIFTLALLFRIHVLADAQVVVDTRNGKVGGHWMTSRGGRQFLAFLKIPYAIPPIENYRFKPPVEIDSWNDIKNETEPGPRCIQYNTYEIKPKVIGDENCLYLAVYTHNTTTRNAVMIHIHGGGFFGGTGPRRTEPHYMMDEDVVIVDINYRLGFLGFLSFEDKEMPGNQGLKDQVLAMKWVQKNIAKFGGDPNKVTLVGESAGAGSAYHHTVSPMSKGLFHRAIAESGTSYNPWGVAPPGHAKATAKKLAKNLGCPTKTTSEAVSCLLKKNASDIASSLETFKVWQIDTGIIWPCLEPPGPHAFLTGPVSNWQHNPVPLMLGTTSGEGLLRTGYFLYYKLDFKWFSDNFDKLGPLSLKYSETASNPAEVTKKLRDYYFSGDDITADSWFNLTQMYTDSWYVIGIIDGANYHTGDTYFYYFDYIGEHTFRKNANRTVFFGAPHTEEMNFIWQNPYANWTHEGDDLKFSKRLVKIWTDFAKFGNPAPKGFDLSWAKWDPRRHNYLVMSNSGFEQKEGFAKDTYNFWKSFNFRDNIK
ncbi:esterase FE4 isoform X1 [Halyomorpha halys]|uniref:esterase FE4 isoform X1 n=1 Tax=Halyomorpha halys TaxID=286706 RepID=UPI0006D4CA5D|nr:esterase FE4 [Halyomorpha halys]